jgi:hypothetical protein
MGDFGHDCLHGDLFVSNLQQTGRKIQGNMGLSIEITPICKERADVFEETVLPRKIIRGNSLLERGLP